MEEKKESKGLMTLLTILIILVLGLIVLEVYKMYDGKNHKNESKVVDNKQEVVEKSIPVEDTFAQYVEASTSMVVSYTYTLKDGKVYEAKERRDMKDSNWAHYDTGYTENTLSDLSDYNSNRISLSEVKNLPAIRRIKGLTVTGTGSDGVGLLLVTEEGKVLIYNFLRGENSIENAKFLDDYKVEDIIGYHVIPACTVGDEPSFKTCGGEYNIIDKDGNTQHYQVKRDGTLTQK